MKILRLNQCIEVKISDASFYFRPLTYYQKIELQCIWEKILKDKTLKLRLSMDAIRLALKYSLVDVIGISDENEIEYKLEKENDCLTDTCLDEILNLPVSKEITACVMSLVNGIPKEIHDPTTGEVLKNVAILSKKKSQK